MLGKAKILLVGCGSMGSAMIKGWTAAGVGEKNYTVVTPQESSVMPLRARCDISWFPNAENIPAEYQPDFVIFAVKPQYIDGILRDYFCYALNGAIMVSVAAGKKLESYKPYVGDRAKIIRIMPNLPVAYNKGVCLGYAGGEIDGLDISLTHALFSSLGKMLWLENERSFDAATTISGCGPAYLYLLVDALTQAGIQAGLEPESAEIMARQAMIGAGVMLEHSTESAAILKKKVASPGGMTEAALKVLERPDTGLPQLMIEAINAAVQKSKDLANATPS